MTSIKGVMLMSVNDWPSLLPTAIAISNNSYGASPG